MPLSQLVKSRNLANNSLSLRHYLRGRSTTWTFQRLFSSSPSAMRLLTVESLNPALQKLEYAVRGELAIKAEALRDELKKPNHTLPFDKVISSNIGNPQQKGLDQPPITFNRQVEMIFYQDHKEDIYSELSRLLHSRNGQIWLNLHLTSFLKM